VRGGARRRRMRRRTPDRPHPRGGAAHLVGLRRQAPPAGGRGVIEIDPKYRDLLSQLSAATAAQEEAQKRVDELGAERARILAELNAAGLSYQKLAGALTAIG